MTLEVGQEVIFIRSPAVRISLSFLHTTEGLGYPLKAQVMIAVVLSSSVMSAGVMVNLGVAVCVCMCVGGKRCVVSVVMVFSVHVCVCSVCCVW